MEVGVEVGVECYLLFFLPTKCLPCFHPVSSAQLRLPNLGKSTVEIQLSERAGSKGCSDS